MQKQGVKILLVVVIALVCFALFVSARHYVNTVNTLNLAQFTLKLQK